VGAVRIDRPFGEENRRRLLAEWFDVGEVTPANAWQHVYRLLLWLDPTTGLAHCYESDKSQPGRPWYARSLAFHSWLADELESGTESLGDDLDWLFRRVVADMEELLAERRASWLAAAQEQRSPYSATGRSMPEPGENSELEDEVRAILADAVQTGIPKDLLSRIVSTVTLATANENKRKNLVGEGFEDTLAFILNRLQPPLTDWRIETRVPLVELPGFYPPRGAEKEKRVDLALVTPDSARRSGLNRQLVTAKWSVRSDREEQFLTDFVAYERRESLGEDFSYVLVTNEFDPARLKAACEIQYGNAPLFAHVVHVNPRGLEAAYNAPATRPSKSALEALEYITAGRLSSLEAWLKQVQDASN
jgi:hypothetical protein